MTEDEDELALEVDWVAWWSGLDDEQREYLGWLVDVWRADRADG
nr:hypothetical protein [uncultured Actinotalea sp.]